MLNVVTWRTSNTYAQNHIVATGYWHAFCGAGMPPAIREVWDDPRNPFKNKGDVTCLDCIEEWKSGRTEGYRNNVPAEQTESGGNAEE